MKLYSPNRSELPPGGYTADLEIGSTANAYPAGVFSIAGGSLYFVRIVALRVTLNTGTTFQIGQGQTPNQPSFDAVKQWGANEAPNLLAVNAAPTAALPDDSFALPYLQEANQIIDMSAMPLVITSNGAVQVWSASLNDSMVLDAWWTVHSSQNRWDRRTP